MRRIAIATTIAAILTIGPCNAGPAGPLPPGKPANITQAAYVSPTAFAIGLIAFVGIGLALTRLDYSGATTGTSG
jgi:hypothetical protein